MTPRGMLHALHWPELVDRLEAEIVESMQQLDAHAGCGHNVATVSICVRCPEQGIRCVPCAQRHYLDDHDLTWRHTCDGCQQHADTLHLVGTEMTLLRGDGRVFHAFVDGMGLCLRCIHRAYAGAGGVG